MTHEELLAKIKEFQADDELDASTSMYALRAVVELHTPKVKPGKNLVANSAFLIAPTRKRN